MLKKFKAPNSISLSLHIHRSSMLARCSSFLFNTHDHHMIALLEAPISVRNTTYLDWRAHIIYENQAHHQNILHKIPRIDIPLPQRKCIIEAPYLTSTIHVPQLPPPPQFINFPYPTENPPSEEEIYTHHSSSTQPFHPFHLINYSINYMYII